MAVKYDTGADASLAQAKKSATLFKKMLQEHQGGGAHAGHGESSVRTAMHKGHKIELKTMYEVKVDGKKVKMNFAPAHDGTVQYHAIPNIAFASAVDLVRCVIDAFPFDFPSKKGKGKPPAPAGGHEHHGGHHMAPRKRKAAAKARKAGN